MLRYRRQADPLQIRWPKPRGAWNASLHGRLDEGSRETVRVTELLDGERCVNALEVRGQLIEAPALIAKVGPTVELALEELEPGQRDADLLLSVGPARFDQKDMCLRSLR